MYVYVNIIANIKKNVPHLTLIIPVISIELQAVLLSTQLIILYRKQFYF